MSDAATFLQHYGKKGMKWGVRNRSRSKIGPSKDSKRTTSIQKKAKKNSVKSLTNKEIQQFNARMELEGKFKSRNPSKLKQAVGVTTSILAVGGTVNSAIKFANSPAGAAIAKSVQKGVKNKGAQKIVSGVY